jgi:hypothetical protein
MEAIGLAIGVPGLAALFLKIGLQGYGILTNARDVPADLDHYIHSIKIQEQRLRDWKDKIDGAKLSHELQSPTDRERYRLIVQTLARIACLFTSISAIEDEYATIDRRVEGQPKSFRPGTVRRLFGRFRRVRKVDEASAIETISASSSPVYPSFEMVVPSDMTVDQLRLVGENVERSGISTQSIKWALRDNEKLQVLLDRLSGYTRNLNEISEPLFISGMSWYDLGLGEVMEPVACVGR